MFISSRWGSVSILLLCRSYLFLAVDSLLCTALHSFIQVHLPFLWIVLTLWLTPNFSMSCGQAEGFCCSLLLLFTQMNFSWFPTRACEWVAWAFCILFFSSWFPSIAMGRGCLVKLEKQGVQVWCLLALRQGPLFP